MTAVRRKPLLQPGLHWLSPGEKRGRYSTWRLDSEAIAFGSGVAASIPSKVVLRLF